MNMALDGESPYDNSETFKYLQRHMSVLKSTGRLPYRHKFIGLGTTKTSNWNAAFYTTDGMRFEVDDICLSTSSGCRQGPKLHESDVYTCLLSSGINDTAYSSKTDSLIPAEDGTCGGCGSYGLNNNPNNTTKPPCVLLVDVNGDRKPTPQNADCNEAACENTNMYKYPAPDSKTVSDIFTIMITESGAIPFGVVAQRAMYNSRQ